MAVGINDRLVRNSDLLLDLLEAVPEGGVVTVPDTLLAATILIPTFDPRRTSAEAAMTTGSVTLVQDDTLRQALSGWWTTWQKTKPRSAQSNRC